MKPTLAALAIVLSMSAWSGTVAAEKFATFAVEHMTCPLCHITVEAAFKSAPGVRKVIVESRKARATVIYDDTATNVAELAAASTNAGYPATVIAQ
jgi:mercuric ion binding protein